MPMMKATVFVAPGRIELVDKPIPEIGPNDALIRITTTTICGTDVHILKGEYPVKAGLIDYAVSTLNLQMQARRRAPSRRG